MADPKEANVPLEPSVGEHGVWGTNSESVGGFGEDYDAQVAHGAEPDLPGDERDQALETAVRKALAQAHVDAADLKVEVRDAHVTLYGSVRHGHEKSELERRARAVAGIEAVKSQLSVLDELDRP